MKIQKYEGCRGTLEILAEGTVEREAEAAGDRIYTLAELPALLAEIRESKQAGKPEIIDTIEELAELAFSRAQACEIT